MAGTNYYRLRMVDKDGSPGNSQMRSVYFDIHELIELRTVTVRDIKLYKQYTSGYYFIHASGKQNQLQTIKIYKDYLSILGIY